VISAKVIGVQEEPHPPTALVADVRRLLGGRGPREQQRRLPYSRWRHDDPALAGLARSVLEAVKPEHTGVPGERLVVVADKEGNAGERQRHRNSGRVVAAQRRASAANAPAG
jgi:hypothetical protein